MEESPTNPNEIRLLDLKLIEDELKTENCIKIEIIHKDIRKSDYYEVYFKPEFNISIIKTNTKNVITDEDESFNEGLCKYLNKLRVCDNSGNGKTDRGKKLECDICEKTFRRKMYLKRHMLSHSGELPFQCERCFKTFLMSHHLDQHKRIHDRIEYACDVCDKIVMKLSTLKKHKL